MNKASAGLPNLDGLRQILAAFQGASANLIPLTDDAGRRLGNNGDELMYRVFEKALAELGITTGSPENAELDIVPPNGALLEMYSFPRILKRRVQKLPKRPLVIFPSSAMFPSRDPAELFDGREVHWILREQNSFNHLDSHWGESLAQNNVRLYLDHDIVASGNHLVASCLAGRDAQRGVLIAARLDKEQMRNPSRNVRASSATVFSRQTRHVLERCFKALPHGRATTLSARLIRHARLNDAAESLVRLLPAETRSTVLASTSSRRASDISAPQYATYDEYCTELRSASLIVTDRLHVALPAAVIGKPVILVETGYHKLSGVYERSLTSLTNVDFHAKARD